MRSVILAFIIALGGFGVANADILPATAAFLRQVSIDPASPQVKMVEDDRVSNGSSKVVSLNSLAAARNEKGVKQFIATRNFLRAVFKDVKTPFPPVELYNADDFMSRDERIAVGRYMLKHF